MSWPWKKKSSSDKAALEKALGAESTPALQEEKVCSVLYFDRCCIWLNFNGIIEFVVYMVVGTTFFHLNVWQIFLLLIFLVCYMFAAVYLVILFLVFLLSYQDNYKKPNYVQISVEQYSHLSGLEDQVKNYESQVKAYDNQVNAYEDQVKTYEEQFQTLEDQITDLNEQLSAAHSEISTQEGLVKQHAKVAEEAVSGMTNIILLRFFLKVS